MTMKQVSNARNSTLCPISNSYFAGFLKVFTCKDHSLECTINLTNALNMNRDTVWCGLQSVKSVVINQWTWDSPDSKEVPELIVNPCFMCDGLKSATVNSKSSDAKKRESKPSLPPLITNMETPILVDDMWTVRSFHSSELSHLAHKSHLFQYIVLCVYCEKS
jgi:hypothetical protein